MPLDLMEGREVQNAEDSLAMRQARAHETQSDCLEMDVPRSNEIYLCIFTLGVEAIYWERTSGEGLRY